MISTSTRKGRIAAVLATAFLVPSLIATAAPDAAPPTRFSCDRACLARHADAYFTALAAHDPSRLPRYRLNLYDPETGGIGVQAVLMSLRLKVDAGLITEVESGSMGSVGTVMA